MISKYAKLFAELDALDKYETWKITELPEGSMAMKVLLQTYGSRKASTSRIRCLTLPDGWLFVRTE